MAPEVLGLRFQGSTAGGTGLIPALGAKNSTHGSIKRNPRKKKKKTTRRDECDSHRDRPSPNPGSPTTPRCCRPPDHSTSQAQAQHMLQVADCEAGVGGWSPTSSSSTWESQGATLPPMPGPLTHPGPSPRGLRRQGRVPVLQGSGGGIQPQSAEDEGGPPMCEPPGCVDLNVRVE